MLLEVISVFEDRKSLSDMQSKVPPEAHGLTPIRYYDELPNEASQKPPGIPDFVEKVVSETPFYRKDLFRASARYYMQLYGEIAHRN